jgi:HD-like signal output (HDOD) protein
VLAVRALTADEIAERVRDLPALPVVVTEVLRATKDPQTSITALAETLARDQALMAKVLRLANSALFGFPRRVGTLSDAVVLLGFSTIRSLVLAGSAFTVMDRAVSGYGLDRGALWEQGMATAVASRYIARKVMPRLCEEGFVGGLIHDLGKIILDSYVGARYGEILDLVRRKSLTFAQAEQAVLGIDHCEVGARVAEVWSLPSDLVATIRYYLRPSDDPEHLELPAIVHLGYISAVSAGVGPGIDGLAYAVDDYAFERLGVGPGIVEEALGQLPEAFADGDRLLQLT